MEFWKLIAGKFWYLKGNFGIWREILEIGGKFWYLKGNFGVWREILEMGAKFCLFEIKSALRGYCTPGQFLDCFFIFLKNYNTSVTNKICFL